MYTLLYYCSMMDVKGIIQKWYKELSEDASVFEEQAQRVGIWDQQLRDNQTRLETMVDDVHRIMSAQADLKTSCDTIEAYQAELENDLNNLNSSLDAELDDLDTQEPTADDCERERTYLLAEELTATLNQMEQNLKKVINNLNKADGDKESGRGAIVDSSSNSSGLDMSASSSAGGMNNSIEKIVSVLNNHHESLVWLDDKSRAMQRDIAVLSKEVHYRSST